MEITQKLRAKNLFLILIFFSCYQFAAAQVFKGIVPLESTCEDVKRILKVEACTLPQSTYQLKEYKISISFTKDKITEKDKLCYKVPPGRVSSLKVNFNQDILIKEFEYDLKYSESLTDDIDSKIYENSEKGISALTNLGFISYVVFAPTPEQHKKFAYECQTPIK